MAEQTDDELRPEDRDRLIDELARKVVDRRLEMPAILFLEMHKPVTFVASQSILVVSPLLAPLFGRESIEGYSHLFSTQENVELLIRRIEDLAEERDLETRKRKNAKTRGN